MTAARPLISKAPPYSVHAEKGLLGALIGDCSRFAEVRGIISGSDVFFRPQHGRLYEAMVDLFEESGAFDTEALAGALQDRQQLAEVGGEAFLGELEDGTGPSTDPVALAREIQEKAIRRHLIDVASDMLSDAYRPDVTMDELLRRARERLDSLTTEGGE
jgi:replicative DNA helicase